jgi:hypothetical protein
MNNIADMSQKQQNRSKTVGKIRARKRQMPAGIDTTNLNFLQYRDVTRVADKMKYTPDYVSKVKNGLCQNVDVLAELLKLGGENRKKLEQATA